MHTRILLFLSALTLGALLLGSGPIPMPVNVMEFEKAVRAMVGQPTRARALLDYCDTVLEASKNPGVLAAAHGYRSHAYWLRNDFGRAETAARASIAAAPDQMLGYFFLADALNGKLRYDDAYLACMLGAKQRATPDKKLEAAGKCRSDYLRHISLTPETLLRTAELKQGQECLLTGRVSEIRKKPEGDRIIFSVTAGDIVCLLSPGTTGVTFRPMANMDADSPPVSTGLKKNELVTLRGVIRGMEGNRVVLEECAPVL